MRSKALVVLVALAMIGVSSAAMARGGGGGGKGGAGHFGHGHHFFNHRFFNNQDFIGGWGWGYGGSGYGNTTTVVYPQAMPQTAEATGSIRAAPCHWNEDTFTVPASAGGSRPVTVVSCR